jgi:hypothetical protein
MEASPFPFVIPRYNYHRAFVPQEIHRASEAKTRVCFSSRRLCSSTSAAMAQEAATLTIDLAQVKAKVSPQLYGLMTEEINYSYDGGLYAELVRNRTFQDRGKIPPAGSSTSGAMPTHRWNRSHHRPSAALPLSLQLTVKSASAHDPGRHQQPGVLGLSGTAANHLPRFVLCQGERCRRSGR